MLEFIQVNKCMKLYFSKAINNKLLMLIVGVFIVFSFVVLSKTIYGTELFVDIEIMNNSQNIELLDG